jgi:hypothetical protein
MAEPWLSAAVPEVVIAQARQSRLQRHPERDVRRASLVEGHRDFQPQRIRSKHERCTS